MDFLILIKNGCDNLTATAAPSVDALGLHMVLSLATIMLVWFGVQEALASAHGGPGFNVGKFLSFFLLITFAYCFVKFYDGSIPGIGYSLKGFVSGGTSSLVDYIGNDSTQEVQNTIHTALSKVGTMSPSLTEPYTLLCTYTFRSSSSILTALIGVIIAYGAIGATIIGLVGPSFHSVDGLRQNGISVLGLAQGFRRLRVLQSRCRRHSERHEPPAHHSI